MSDASAREALIQALSSLRGKPVWHVMCGPVHGPVIALSIGGRRERVVPLTNPRVSEEVRRFEGEFDLFISCAWRLAVQDEVLCGSLSRNESDGDIVGGATLLVGRTIVDVAVTRFLDVSLELDGASLTIFCDEVDLDDPFDNYALTLEDAILVVAPRSVVHREARDHSFRPLLRLV